MNIDEIRFYKMLLIIVLIVSFSVYSQKKEITFTLDGYIDYALSHNPSIHAAGSSIKASMQEIRLATALPDPMIMGRAGIDNGLMPASIGVSQMIMQPVTIAFEKKYAKYKKEAEEARLYQAASDVVYRVRSIYFILYETGQLIKIKNQNLALLRQYEELTKTAYANGTVAQSSLIKVGLEISRLEDGIRSDELKTVTLHQELAAVLGINEYVKFPFPESKPLLKNAIQPDSIVILVQHKYPGLNAMRKEILSEKAMQASAKSRFLPDISFGIEYMKSSDAITGSAADETWMLSPSVSLSIPVWFGKKAALVQKAGFNAMKMEQQTNNMQNMIVAQAVMFKNELHDAQLKEKLLSEVLVPQARQMLVLMENEYRTGISRSLDVLDGQRMLFDLEMEKIMEQTRALNAEAALLQLVGDTGMAEPQ